MRRYSSLPYLNFRLVCAPRIAGALFAALISGDRHHENDGTLEAAQRIAGHADSRTTKLYDRSGQKVLLEDMERIRY